MLVEANGSGCGAGTAKEMEARDVGGQGQGGKEARRQDGKDTRRHTGSACSMHYHAMHAAGTSK
jgi:hypothetical protein